MKKGLLVAVMALCIGLLAGCATTYQEGEGHRERGEMKISGDVPRFGETVYVYEAFYPERAGRTEQIIVWEYRNDENVRMTKVVNGRIPGLKEEVVAGAYVVVRDRETTFKFVRER